MMRAISRYLLVLASLIASTVLADVTAKTQETSTASKIVTFVSPKPEQLFKGNTGVSVVVRTPKEVTEVQSTLNGVEIAKFSATS